MDNNYWQTAIVILALVSGKSWKGLAHLTSADGAVKKLKAHLHTEEFLSLTLGVRKWVKGTSNTEESLWQE